MRCDDVERSVFSIDPTGILFIGPHLVTGLQAALRAAERYRQSGHAPVRIWLQTDSCGQHRGATGLPPYTILQPETVVGRFLRFVR